jgi:hypothetical protein
VERRLISVPMRAKDAQPPIDQGKPHMATKTVAKPTLCTTGAKIMLMAKSTLAIIHAIGRVGFQTRKPLSIGGKPAGGRGVYGGPSSSGPLAR